MSDSSNTTKQELLKRLIGDEEEDDVIMLFLLSSNSNKIDALYTSRYEEGSYQILINKHLKAKEKKFRKYCRLNKKLPAALPHWLRSGSAALPASCAHHAPGRAAPSRASESVPYKSLQSGAEATGSRPPRRRCRAAAAGIRMLP
ncbi:unnamed protein product [Parnassius apollo]|uniref:(apollo) hypothetical protein n=1 Tax=Parnassius apollo TaxID=110799 RepID=A0A8S3XYV4_PARAO|nr:unnamed protein product [Parnassius apollo]